jgi:hypothetical protein
MSDPKRTEVTVLGPDDPKQKTIGFACYDRQGTTVYRLDDDFRCGVAKNPITRREDLHEGDEIVVAALTGGYHGMKIKEDEYGELQAEGEGLAALLKFGEDDRECWVCLALVNLQGIKKATHLMTIALDANHGFKS